MYSYELPSLLQSNDEDEEGISEVSSEGDVILGELQVHSQYRDHVNNLE